MQHLYYPLKVMRLTQGVNGSFSHQGTFALDDGGHDCGIDNLYAPCDVIVKAKDTAKNGNAVWFQSIDKVQFVDGTIEYATMMFIHDNDVSDLFVGKTFKQSEVIYQEGTAGKATGAHVHIEVAKGPFTRMYWKNKCGVWQLPNAVHPDCAFYVDNTTIKNGMGYDWRKITSSEGNGWRRVGNSSKWNYYNNGRKVVNDMIWDKETKAWYAFDEFGIMIRSGFFKYQGKYVWLEESGKMAFNTNITFIADNSGYLTKQ